MADYPYTQVTGKLKAFFEKIQQVGKPETVDKKWLSSIGLTASNDPTIVPVLKFVDFVDSSNKPTARWMTYRDKSRAKRVLAEGILLGYDELFQTYPDAYRRSDDELKAFFTTRTTAGVQAISKTVSTFKSLCELADFSFVDLGVADGNAESSTNTLPGVTASSVQPTNENLPFTPKLHIDVQIHISPDTTPQQIEQIFESMAKHIYRIKG